MKYLVSIVKKAETSPPGVTLGLGLLGLFAIALGLHTWGLGWFHSLVFDEVYYVPFALNYLAGQPFFDAHPPLGKYLIALGIALGQAPANWGSWPTLGVEGHLLSPLSFRWLNALVGATLPVIAALLGFYLSAVFTWQRRLAFSFLAGALVMVSGLPLAESRFALINLYWVWFGLLGQLFWVISRAGAESHPGRSAQRLMWRMAAGMALGAAVNVKWNGAGFWLGIVLLEVILRWRVIPRPPKPALPWKSLLLYLGLIPFMTYSLLWVPHLQINQVSLITIHRQLWTAHQSIGDTLNPHPYCSAWYTWPLMLRPVAYFFQRVANTPPESILAPVRGTGVITYTVQGMGNPLLWWLSTAAVVSLGAGQMSRWGQRYLSDADGARDRERGNLHHSQSRRVGRTHPAFAYPKGATASRGNSPVVSFVLVNYVANWLPWMLVHRCTFLYHALGMMIFGNLALAWLLSRWLLDRRWHYRVMAWLMAVVILWGFWFWLPVFMGLPLAPEALQQRWWLRSWI